VAGHDHAPEYHRTVDEAVASVRTGPAARTEEPAGEA
jgi:hypothetical protein